MTHKQKRAFVNRMKIARMKKARKNPRRRIRRKWTRAKIRKAYMKKFGHRFGHTPDGKPESPVRSVFKKYFKRKAKIRRRPAGSGRGVSTLRDVYKGLNHVARGISAGHGSIALQNIRRIQKYIRRFAK